MSNLTENDRSIKDFCNDPGLRFEIAFSRWTQRKSQNTQQIIYSDGGSTDVEYLKLILCSPPSSGGNALIKKHLVLFVKESSSVTPDDFTQNLSIDISALSNGDRIQCVVVTYLQSENNIPSPDQIDCALYHSIANGSEDDPTVPDTTQGEIIIKR